MRLKTADEIELMREAGRVLARVMRTVSEAIEPGRTTILQLDTLADELITGAGCIPSFKGYKGFPNAACISRNDVVVHGIPTEEVLVEGDIVSLDFGVIREGWHADSAWTFPVGQISDDARRLLSVTKECLMQGIAKARVGNRVGDISATVQKYAESNGYGVVRDLVGHGIGVELHEPPSVPNFGRAKTGPVLREGVTMCIEPMINQGTHKVRFESDGWTVRTADGRLSAHFEHTIAVTSSGPVILTQE
ncbi:MAG: type I methionyl aminopeptidase [Fimbriimonadaceae bacterium]|nr:type I methionyl aminopeptidase [Fimbriimonadaceae bacterium]